MLFTYEDFNTASTHLSVVLATALDPFDWLAVNGRKACRCRIQPKNSAKRLISHFVTRIWVYPSLKEHYYPHKGFCHGLGFLYVIVVVFLYCFVIFCNITFHISSCLFKHALPSSLWRHCIHVPPQVRTHWSTSRHTSVIDGFRDSLPSHFSFTDFCATTLHTN